MGDPKRTRKSYVTPRHPWRRDQLEVELHLIGDFGLRNKRELWRYKTMLSEVRGIARSMLPISSSGIIESKHCAEVFSVVMMRRMAKLRSIPIRLLSTDSLGRHLLSSHEWDQRLRASVERLIPYIPASSLLCKLLKV